jgi:hypothetical protein
MKELDALATGPDALASQVRELAASCEQHVLGSVGLALDGSIETLPLLDHYLRVSARESERRPELVPLLSRTVGAYFGQVVAAAFGGFWWLPSADVHRWYVCLRPVYLAINPVGMAHAALTWSHARPPGDAPPTELMLAAEDRELVESRLSGLPPVQEPDYFALCTRVEALEVAVAALGEQMALAGTADVTFDDDDYVEQLGDPQL